MVTGGIWHPDSLPLYSRGSTTFGPGKTSSSLSGNNRRSSSNASGSHDSTHSRGGQSTGRRKGKRRRRLSRIGRLLVFILLLFTGLWLILLWRWMGVPTATPQPGEVNVLLSHDLKAEDREPAESTPARDADKSDNGKLTQIPRDEQVGDGSPNVQRRISPVNSEARARASSTTGEERPVANTEDSVVTPISSPPPAPREKVVAREGPAEESPRTPAKGARANDEQPSMTRDVHASPQQPLPAKMGQGEGVANPKYDDVSRDKAARPSSKDTPVDNNASAVNERGEERRVESQGAEGGSAKPAAREDARQRGLPREPASEASVGREDRRPPAPPRAEADAGMPRRRSGDALGNLERGSMDALSRSVAEQGKVFVEKVLDSHLKMQKERRVVGESAARQQAGPAPVSGAARQTRKVAGDAVVPTPVQELRGEAQKASAGGAAAEEALRAETGDGRQRLRQPPPPRPAREGGARQDTDQLLAQHEKGQAWMAARGGRVERAMPLRRETPPSELRVPEGSIGDLLRWQMPSSYERGTAERGEVAGAAERLSSKYTFAARARPEGQEMAADVRQQRWSPVFEQDRQPHAAAEIRHAAAEIRHAAAEIRRDSRLREAAGEVHAERWSQAFEADKQARAAAELRRDSAGGGPFSAVHGHGSVGGGARVDGAFSGRGVRVTQENLRASESIAGPLTEGGRPDEARRLNRWAYAQVENTGSAGEARPHAETETMASLSESSDPRARAGFVRSEAQGNVEDREHATAHAFWAAREAEKAGVVRRERLWQEEAQQRAAAAQMYGRGRGRFQAGDEEVVKHAWMRADPVRPVAARARTVSAESAAQQREVSEGFEDPAHRAGYVMSEGEGELRPSVAARKPGYLEKGPRPEDWNALSGAVDSEEGDDDTLEEE
ncbi:hypothetical protein BESB_069470 [Besnoitia besnoiti]|uniref:Transmembrane protein n=1 Tax=Besnoitia besnoiti TaxID=94643 RepID=A0A2A9MCG4_BESBE|nr:hypothetical protein BESB_069470 [Besnoitia besnoiti]PFH34914.1 hypothetical protein BESB_069470 [Besnoitia besnoiti]